MKTVGIKLDTLDEQSVALDQGPTTAARSEPPRQSCFGRPVRRMPTGMPPAGQMPSRRVLIFLGKRKQKLPTDPWV